MTTVYRPARDHRMRIIHVAPCGHIILSAVTLHRGHCNLCDPLCEGEPVDIRPLFYSTSKESLLQGSGGDDHV
jgi:hypothetical protein